jgi:hypothetical protein
VTYTCLGGQHKYIIGLECHENHTMRKQTGRNWTKPVIICLPGNFFKIRIWMKQCIYSCLHIIPIAILKVCFIAHFLIASIITHWNARFNWCLLTVILTFNLCHCFIKKWNEYYFLALLCTLNTLSWEVGTCKMQSSSLPMNHDNWRVMSTAEPGII